jgi:hypothetical protein
LYGRFVVLPPRLLPGRATGPQQLMREGPFMAQGRP